MITERKFLIEMKNFIDSFDSKTACAQFLRISRQHLYDLYQGKKPISDALARKMGWMQIRTCKITRTYEAIK